MFNVAFKGSWGMETLEFDVNKAFLMGLVKLMDGHDFLFDRLIPLVLVPISL